jgi:uncharacterized protein (TIGR03435 family)
MKTFILAAALAWGQALDFEVASVKPAVQAPGIRSRMRSDGDRIIFTYVTLTSVLLRAYDIKTYQLSGPGWLGSERYDITAKIPAGATKEEVNRMLQRLAADRFHLVSHHETRQMQGYELVRTKAEPKLKRSTEAGSEVQPTEAPETDANGFAKLTAPGLVILEGVRGKAVVSFVTARAQPLSALVELLGKEFRMPVSDETGLKGKFDFTLEFAPEAPGVPLPGAGDDAAPNMMDAIPQQLGLRLAPRKIAVDVLIVDVAEKFPTGD